MQMSPWLTKQVSNGNVTLIYNEVSYEDVTLLKTRVSNADVTLTDNAGE